MTNTQKYVTISVAFIGMISGLTSAYVTWSSDKFKQPIDKHASTVASFKGQIDSAEKRKDRKEVTRLRVE